MDLDILKTVRETLINEGSTILHQAKLIDEKFETAVRLIADSRSKVIVTGMGKSGIIGHKIAATLTSTGTTAVFLHPAEAYHGDLGIINSGDIVLALSFSGETDEVLKLIPFFKENKNEVISVTGDPKSTLALNSTIHLYAYVEKEACPLQLAPTTSTTLTLALGDALAIALMKLNNFKAENFAKLHPGGSLGKKLLSKVETVMQKNNLPIASPHSNFVELVNIINKGRLGLALVNQEKKTIGIITDGDLRRFMEKYGKKVFDFEAKDMMTKNPKSIIYSESLSAAETKMVNNKINSLVVLNHQKKTLGIVQIYDLA